VVAGVKLLQAAVVSVTSLWMMDRDIDPFIHENNFRESKRFGDEYVHVSYMSCMMTLYSMFK
jgi:hypothetical protein